MFSQGHTRIISCIIVWSIYTAWCVFANQSTVFLNSSFICPALSWFKVHFYYTIQDALQFEWNYLRQLLDSPWIGCINLIMIWVWGRWVVHCPRRMRFRYVSFLWLRNNLLCPVIQWNLPVTTTSVIKKFTCDLFSNEFKTEATNLLLLTISAFWSSSRWPLAT